MLKVAKNIVAIISLSAALFGENLDMPLAVDQDPAFNNPPAASAPVATPTSSGYSLRGGPFVGLELTGVFAVEGDTVKGRHSGSGLNVGLRLGAENEEWRTMAVLSRFDSSDDDSQSYTRAFLELDYYFLGQDNLVIDSFILRPYLGVSGGWINYDGGFDENVNALTYGGQVGAIMNLTDKVDLDMALRYSLTTSENVDHITGATIGINYRY